MGEMNGCVFGFQSQQLVFQSQERKTYDVDHMLLDVFGRHVRQQIAANGEQRESQQRNLLLSRSIRFDLNAFQHEYNTIQYTHTRTQQTTGRRRRNKSTQR
jgi:hypothetical protein